MRCAPKGLRVEGLINPKPVDPFVEKGLRPEGSDFLHGLATDGNHSLTAQSIESQ